jgi:hypothetical protein
MTLQQHCKYIPRSATSREVSSSDFRPVDPLPYNTTVDGRGPETLSLGYFDALVAFLKSDTKKKKKKKEQH